MTPIEDLPEEIVAHVNFLIDAAEQQSSDP